MNIYIAYDTSCYTTSIAAVNEDGQVLASCRKMLPVDLGSRGLRQSEAVFKHIQQINEVNEELYSVLRSYNYSIKGVGASVTPRGIEESYMPVFTVGTAFAKHIAQSYHVPFVSSNHQLGHIKAAKYLSGLQSNRFLGFHLSGGTTELLLCNNGLISIIGATNDISLGKCLDRVGVAMGLPFPSGVYLEKLAVSSQSEGIIIPSSVHKNPIRCNLSGAETFALSKVKVISAEELALSLFKMACNTICKMIVFGVEQTQVYEVLLFGGVASSNLLRTLIQNKMAKLNNRVKIYFGKNEFSGDNAVGVALDTWEVCTNESK
ncbi:MAG: O-sialoglycoprotein endopeptidase [Eubacteriales bacterium]|nr:O-sialoglycoprotein endopeptidase [Eubacteriales bacterium]